VHRTRHRRCTHCADPATPVHPLQAIGAFLKAARLTPADVLKNPALCKVSLGGWGAAAGTAVGDLDLLYECMVQLHVCLVYTSSNQLTWHAVSRP
jgi:hypothetical protein